MLSNLVFNVQLVGFFQAYYFLDVEAEVLIKMNLSYEDIKHFWHKKEDGNRAQNDEVD